MGIPQEVCTTMIEYWGWYFTSLHNDFHHWLETGDLSPGSPLGAIAAGSLGLVAGIGQVIGGGSWTADQPVTNR